MRSALLQGSKPEPVLVIAITDGVRQPTEFPATIGRGRVAEVSDDRVSTGHSATAHDLGFVPALG